MMKMLQRAAPPEQMEMLLKSVPLVGRRDLNLSCTFSFFFLVGDGLVGNCNEHSLL